MKRVVVLNFRSLYGLRFYVRHRREAFPERAHKNNFLVGIFDVNIPLCRKRISKLGKFIFGNRSVPVFFHQLRFVEKGVFPFAFR